MYRHWFSTWQIGRDGDLTEGTGDMPKNIVLLSDGTGNAASSPFKTNVWRLYQTIDISPPQNGDCEQIALYDNGVGTGSFRPLAVLGLAIGLGVATNVKNLYTFLCRNYEDGDRIYLFGFSRGAFTIRILSGLILRCGLVTAPNDAELDRRVKLAYAEYKRDVARRATKTRPWLLAGWVLGGWQKGDGTDRIDFEFQQHYPDIELIGVWDTVDAYGMPIDELKEGIDHYVWPMTLADRRFSDRIHRACHALSLDDERPTFRPVLWSEPQDHPERLSQVWFSGVHANVGGGYPDDGLSCTALQWIMDEAERSHLRLHRSAKEECDDLANPHGQQYDSRAGLAGYYRYGPRNLDRLCEDPDHGVHLSHTLIHAAAIDRIAERRAAYAPVSLPVSVPYKIVGRSVGAHAQPALAPVAIVESPAHLAERAEAMELAYDAVFRRRVAYLTTVAGTVILALLPAFDWLASHDWTARRLAGPIALIDAIGSTLTSIPLWSQGTRWLGDQLLTWGPEVAPGWASPWVTSFAQHPAAAMPLAVIVLWLFVRKSALLQADVSARAEYAWRHVRNAAAHQQAPKPAVTDPLVRLLRTNKALGVLYRWLTMRLVPALFALVVALPLGLLVLVFFLPKFRRNSSRRRQYKVKFVARVPG
jgi:uncharacterized protein (DUF2235 family)